MITVLSFLFLGHIYTPPSIEVKYVSSIADKNKITYTPHRKLTWSDFKTVPDNMNTAALTASEISYKIDVMGDHIQVAVFCFFDKTRSVVSMSQKKEHILNHEQRHFDITYLFAQQFIQSIKCNPYMDMKEIETLYDHIIKEWTIFQNQYDVETKNAISKDQQEKWNQKIEQALSRI